MSDQNFLTQQLQRLNDKLDEVFRSLADIGARLARLEEGRDQAKAVEARVTALEARVTSVEGEVKEGKARDRLMMAGLVALGSLLGIGGSEAVKAIAKVLGAG